MHPERFDLPNTRFVVWGETIEIIVGAVDVTPG